MSEKLDIFTDTSCPSLEVLRQYADDRLNPRDRQRLEQHMLDCPLCADALEGMNLVGDPNRISASVHRIKTESKRRLYEHPLLREHNSKRRSRVSPRHFTQYAAAAAAAIFILWIGVFIYRDLNQAQTVYEKHFQAEANQSAAPLSDSVYAEASAPDPKMPDTPPAAVEEATAGASTRERSRIQETEAASAEEEAVQPVLREEISPKPQTETPTGTTSSTLGNNFQKDQKETQKELATQGGRTTSASPANLPNRALAESASTQESESTEDVVSDAVVAQTDTLSTRVPIDRETLEVDEVRVQSAPGYDDRIVSMSQKQREQAARAESIKKQERIANYSQAAGVKFDQAFQDADMLNARQAYAAGQYQVALNALENVLAKYPQYTEAQYLAGRSWLALSQPTKAIPMLKSVLDSGTPQYFEEAQWQLAGAYLLRNRKQPARKLLRQIEAAGGTYAPKAKEALEDL